jgi:hypothetical protein
MKNRTLIVLLAIIAVLLAGNLIVQLMPGRGSSAASNAPSLILNAAQANTIQSSNVLGDRDGYVITSDASGESVYVYYFDRSAVENDTTIKFITKARAN